MILELTIEELTNDYAPCADCDEYYECIREYDRTDGEGRWCPEDYNPEYAEGNNYDG